MPTPSATNRTLWLNASDNDLIYTAAGNPPTGAVSNGNEVQQWLAEEGDMSARYRVATSDSPTWNSAGINSLGALQFNGTDDEYSLRADDGTTARTVANIFTANHTVFIAFRMTGAPFNNTTNPYINDALMADGGSYWGIHLTDHGGTYSIDAFCYSGSSQHYASQTILLDTDYVVMMRSDGTNIYCSINNGSEASTASGNPDNTTNEVVIGASQFGDQFTNARIGEILVYNAALTGTPFTDTYQYMLDKWTATAPSNATATPAGATAATAFGVIAFDIRPPPPYTLTKVTG